MKKHMTPYNCLLLQFVLTPLMNICIACDFETGLSIIIGLNLVFLLACAGSFLMGMYPESQQFKEELAKMRADALG